MVSDLTLLAGLTPNATELKTEFVTGRSRDLVKATTIRYGFVAFLFPGRLAGVDQIEHYKRINRFGGKYGYPTRYIAPTTRGTSAEFF
jgi:hypothetical protein